MRYTDSFWTQKTVHIRIMTAIVVMSILLAAILRRPVIRYADAAARIFQIYIPILAGIILFLLCLVTAAAFADPLPLLDEVWSPCLFRILCHHGCAWMYFCWWW